MSEKSSLNNSNFTSANNTDDEENDYLNKELDMDFQNQNLEDELNQSNNDLINLSTNKKDGNSTTNNGRTQHTNSITGVSSGANNQNISQLLNQGATGIGADNQV